MKDARKKILVLASTFPRWKNDTTPPFVLDISSALKKLGENIIVLAPHAPKAKMKEVMQGIKIIRFTYFYPISLQKLAYDGGILPNIKKYFLAKIQVLPFLISEFMSLILITKKNDISIIYSHWIIPHGFFGAIVKKFFRKKHVVTAHAGDLALLNKLPFKKNIANFIMRNTDHMIFVSKYGKNIFLKIAENKNKNIQEKISVIPMGINLQNFKTNFNNKQIRKKLNLENKIVVLFIGRLAEKKGVEYLIRSVKIALKSVQSIHAIIIGDGPLKDQLLNIVAEEKLAEHISILGSKFGKDKLEYLSIADILVVPSITTKMQDVEGVPVVIMEGFAMGKVIIASNVGGISEMIDNNVNGVLVPEKNVQILAKTMIKIAKHKHRYLNLSKNAKKQANKYNIDTISKQYRTILNRYL